MTVDIDVRPDSITLPIIPEFLKFPSPLIIQASTYHVSHTIAPNATLSRAIQNEEAAAMLPTPSSSQSSSHESKKDSEDSQECSLSIMDSLSEAHESDDSSAIFPSRKYILYHPLHYVRHPDFSYQTELRFTEVEYQAYWNQPAVDLTNRLIPRNSNHPMAVGHYERDFAGVYIRLFLNPAKTAGLAPFHRGTVVDFCNLNTPHCKYIVECCQRDSEGVAFIKVVCHTEDQRVFPSHDADRPIFILAIPSRLNGVPYLLQAAPAPFPHMSNTLSPSLLLPSLSFQGEYIEEWQSQSDFSERLQHIANFLCPCF